MFTGSVGRPPSRLETSGDEIGAEIADQISAKSGTGTSVALVPGIIAKRLSLTSEKS